MGLSFASRAALHRDRQRDIYQNARIPLRPLRNNVPSMSWPWTRCSIGLTKINAPDAWEEIYELVGQVRVKPLPYRAVPASRIRFSVSSHRRADNISVSCGRGSELFSRRGEIIRSGFDVKCGC